MSRFLPVSSNLEILDTRFGQRDAKVVGGPPSGAH